MSISTKRGDAGETSLAGGVRVSKADLRVEAYGTVDELTSLIGFARSICANTELSAQAREIQKILFRIISSLATPPESGKRPPEITSADVDELTALVKNIEAREGILNDWSIPGEHTGSAAFDLARAVCRRAERAIVRLVESGGVVEPFVLAYINRLSDALWMIGRAIELEANVDSSLREKGSSGPCWSRAV